MGSAPHIIDISRDRLKRTIKHFRLSKIDLAAAKKLKPREARLRAQEIGRTALQAQPQSHAKVQADLQRQDQSPSRISLSKSIKVESSNQHQSLKQAQSTDMYDAPSSAQPATLSTTQPSSSPRFHLMPPAQVPERERGRSNDRGRWKPQDQYYDGEGGFATDVRRLNSLYRPDYMTSAVFRNGRRKLVSEVYPMTHAVIVSKYRAWRR